MRADFTCTHALTPTRTAVQVDAETCYDEAEDADWKNSKKYSRQKQGGCGMEAKHRK